MKKIQRINEIFISALCICTIFLTLIYTTQISATTNVLYSNDFSEVDSWPDKEGTWVIADGVFTTTGGGAYYANTISEEWGNYEVEFDMQFDTAQPAIIFLKLSTENSQSYKLYVN